jgi:Tfp pilus assembly protein PilV
MRQDGFTLVEVMVAVGLTVGAVLAMATMSLTATERVHRSGEMTSAVALGEQRLEWLRTQSWSSPALTPGATIETLGGDFAGYVRTTTVQNDTPLVGLKRTTVVVETPSGRRVQLTSLFGRS